ncbi:MAG: D-glycero-alpha-D-manno-heptose-1,7-bisphosphate 7-phosphatase [Bacteroidales bacterium]
MRKHSMNLQHLKIDSSWTLFLDRDGVINRRIVDGYAKSWDQFEFLPGVHEALKHFRQVFGTIVVVSNQQGVGKGLMTDLEVQGIHREMVRQIHNSGGGIDAVFYSPYLHAERSIMRKPNIGMALKARKQFPAIRFSQSLMVGDSLSDMVFGKRLRMTTVFISPDALIARKHPWQINFLFPDLISLAHAL